MIADSLDTFHGPTSGIVTLPHHLDWSGFATYDLDEPAILATMYKTILLEAATLEDLCTWLDRDRLTQIWPELWASPGASPGLAGALSRARMCTRAIGHHAPPSIFGSLLRRR